MLSRHTNHINTNTNAPHKLHEKIFKALVSHHYKPYICAVLTKVCKNTDETRTTVH